MRVLLVAAGLCVGASAWADDWSSVWTADFSAAPSGMTYSVTSGSTNLDNGYLHYNQGGGSGNRAINTAFTATAFNVDTNWKMEFDWNCSASNSSASNVTFATNKGSAFTITWASYATTASITDANTNSLTTTLPTMGTSRGSASSWAHFTIIGNTENGVYLTVTKDGTTYVDNVLVTSTFGYPATFNGSLGRAYSWMYIDNIDFATPAVAGFIASPTALITGTYNTQRKFTLSCLTENTTIYYATSDIEIGADGWTQYTSEVTTSATTVWAYAKDESDNTSEKMSFETGAGTNISLATPTLSASGFTNTDGNSVNNPTFNFACDNSEVLGRPTATLSYTFTPAGGAESSETTGTSFAPTAYGTLKVIASADGYASAEKTLVVSSLYTISYTGRDYSTSTHEDSYTTWDAAATVNWSGWASGLTAYLSSTAISDDNHLNIQNPGTISLVEGWGLVRGDQKTYGYRVRYAKEGEFIALKENTSKGSDAAAVTYQTTYCISGSGAQGNLVTITAPAGNAIQQLFHYAPSQTSVSATVTSAGWATLYTPYALNFSGVTGLEAYTATCSENTVTLTKVSTVPAGTGVVLKGAANTYSIPVIASSTTDKGHLLGSATEATAYNAYDGYTLYMLKMVNEKAQFVPMTSGSLAAGKAYLKIASGNSSLARSLNVVFADETTGINSVNGDGVTVNGYFNLSGQRVSQPTKGLYIVNGKKVIIK